MGAGFQGREGSYSSTGSTGEGPAAAPHGCRGTVGAAQHSQAAWAGSTEQDTVFRRLQSATAPHGLHVGVALPSEELVAAVGPHDVLVHRELHLAPEILLLIRAHGQPANTSNSSGQPGQEWDCHNEQKASLQP